MTKKRLMRYCDEHDIFYPKTASLEYLQAAIVRAHFNSTEKPVKGQKGCFGFWEQDESNCVICDFKDKCFKASIGMDREAYFKSFKALDNPRIRLKPTARSSRRNSRKG